MRLFASILALSALLGCADTQPYQNCSRNVLCAGSTPLCLATTSSTGHTAAFCTEHCSTAGATASATECPANSACVRVNGGDLTCMKRCSTDADCPFTNGTCQVNGDSLGAHICAVR